MGFDIKNINSNTQDFLKSELGQDKLAQYYKDKVTIRTEWKVWEGKYIEKNWNYYEVDKQEALSSYGRQLLTNNFCIVSTIIDHQSRTLVDITDLNYNVSDYKWEIEWKKLNYLIFNKDWIIVLLDTDNGDIKYKPSISSADVSNQDDISLESINWVEYILLKGKYNSSKLIDIEDSNKRFNLDNKNYVISNDVLYMQKGDYHGNNNETLNDKLNVQEVDIVHWDHGDDTIYVLENNKTLHLFDEKSHEKIISLHTNIENLENIPYYDLKDIADWKYENVRELIIIEEEICVNGDSEYRDITITKIK